MNFLEKASLTLFMAVGMGITGQSAALAQGTSLKQAPNKMAAASSAALSGFTKNTAVVSNDSRGPKAVAPAEKKAQLAADEKGNIYDVTSLTDKYNVHAKDCKWKFDNVDGTKMATMIMEAKDMDGTVLSLSVSQKLVNSQNNQASLETSQGDAMVERYMVKSANGDIKSESYKLKGQKTTEVNHTGVGPDTYKSDIDPVNRFYEMAPVYDAGTKFKPPAAPSADKQIIASVQKLSK